MRVNEITAIEAVGQEVGGGVSVVSVAVAGGGGGDCLGTPFFRSGPNRPAVRALSA